MSYYLKKKENLWQIWSECNPEIRPYFVADYHDTKKVLKALNGEQHGLLTNWQQAIYKITKARFKYK